MAPVTFISQKKRPLSRIYRETRLYRAASTFHNANGLIYWAGNVKWSER